MMARDYYDTLGVSKNATPDEIKRAYRELALKLHPDRNKSPDATERFKAINEAYAVLGDPQKRQQYDMMGSAQFNQWNSQEDIFRGFDFESIFKDMGFNMAGMGNFEDMFGGGMGPRPGQRQQHFEENLNLNLNLSEMQKGFDREIEVQHYVNCPNCRGNGAEPGSKTSTCPECKGTGTVRRGGSQGMGAFFFFQSSCGRCGGRGFVIDKPCKICKGRGETLVREKFRIRIEKK